MRRATQEQRDGDYSTKKVHVTKVRLVSLKASLLQINSSIGMRDR